MEGRIFQLNISNGGVPKLPVREAVLTPNGLEGDRQAHPLIHGGPERTLCLYALELILKLQAEGHPIYPGSIGENVTVCGLDWAGLKPETRLAFGDEALIEIASYTKPCKTIAASFLSRSSDRVSQKRHPGASRLYARVLRPGRLWIGQAVRVVGAKSY